MKTCRYVRKKLSAYQDGEVGLAEKEVIEAHLCTCEACTKQQEALLQTYRILRRLPEIDPTPKLSRQIVGRSTSGQNAFWVRSMGQALHLLPAPAAIVVVAAAGILLGTMLGSFLTERQFRPAWTFSAFHSGQALTLASIRVFDVTPPGSFAEGYLQLAGYKQERSHEK